MPGGMPNLEYDQVENAWVLRGKGGARRITVGDDNSLGLYGVAAVTRQAHLGDPTRGSATANSDAIGSILVALENLGILSTS